MKKIIMMIIMMVTVSSQTISAMEVVDCGGLEGVPYKPLEFVGNIIKLMQIAVPVLLVIMGMIDLAKAMTAKDEQRMKESSSIFVKRLIYGVLVFFVVAIVQFLFSLLDAGDSIMTCASCVVGNDCETTDLTIQSVKNSGVTGKKEVTNITILNKKTKIEKGKSFTISTRVSPSNATNKKLTYKSSKKSVATVNSSGKVTAKKVGKTTITVQSKSNKNVKKNIYLEVVKKGELNNSSSTTSNSSNLTTSSSSKGVGDYTYYNQGDYSNVNFCGNGKTLRSSGCGAVSFSMVASNLVNSSYNPKIVANWLCSNGHGGGALSDSWFTKKKLLNKFGLKSTKLFGNIGTSGISSAKKKIIKELNDGKMIILYIPGHYVTLASGGKDKVIMLNPGKRADNGTYSIDQIYNNTKNYKNRCTSSNNCGWHGAYSFSKK